MRKSDDHCAPKTCDERREVCEDFIRGMTFSSNTTGVFVPSSCRSGTSAIEITQPPKTADAPNELRIRVKRLGSHRVGLHLTQGDWPLGTLSPSDSDEVFTVKDWSKESKQKYRLYGAIGEETGARVSVVCGADRKKIPLGNPIAYGKLHYYEFPLPQVTTDSLDCEVVADLSNTKAESSVTHHQCCFCEIGSNPKDKDEDEEKCKTEFAYWATANKSFCDFTETRKKESSLINPKHERSFISRNNEKFVCENSLVISADHSHSGQLQCFVDSVTRMLDSASLANRGQPDRVHVFELKDCGCAGGSDLKNGIPSKLLRELETRFKDSEHSAVAELTLNQTTVTFGSTSWAKIRIDIDGLACKKDRSQKATVKINLSYIPCKELFSNDCDTYLGATAKCDLDGTPQAAKCCHPPYKSQSHSWYLTEDCKRTPPCEYDDSYFRTLKGASLYPNDVEASKLVGSSCSAADVPIPYACKKKDGTEQPLICQEKVLVAQDKLKCSSLVSSPTICYQPGKTLDCLDGNKNREAKCCYDFSFPKGSDPAHPPWERFYSKWKQSEKCALELDGGDCDVLAKKWCAEEPALTTYKPTITCLRKGKKCKATCSPSGEFDLDRGTHWEVRCPADSGSATESATHQ